MFDPSSLFTRAKFAAAYLGIAYKALLAGQCGTICLNEYRRDHKQNGNTKGAAVYLTCQVIAHGQNVLRYGECNGRCKRLAENALKQARAA
jgi:hypothetical protein